VPEMNMTSDHLGMLYALEEEECRAPTSGAVRVPEVAGMDVRIRPRPEGDLGGPFAVPNQVVDLPGSLVELVCWFSLPMIKPAPRTARTARVRAAAGTGMSAVSLQPGVGQK
jgi:hypothetical protein